MKTIAFIAICAFAMSALAQDPKVRLEKLTDAEYSEYKTASDAREQAAKDYLAANEKFESERAKIVDAHQAREVTPSCDTHFSRTSEWKGRYIIVSEGDNTSQDTYRIGCAGTFMANPITFAVGTDSLNIIGVPISHGILSGPQ